MRIVREFACRQLIRGVGHTHDPRMSEMLQRLALVHLDYCARDAQSSPESCDHSTQLGGAEALGWCLAWRWEMCWRCVGDGRCIGDVLEMYWRYVGDVVAAAGVQEMWWRCAVAAMAVVVMAVVVVVVAAVVAAVVAHSEW